MTPGPVHPKTVGGVHPYLMAISFPFRVDPHSGGVVTVPESSTQHINETIAPAYTLGPITRPELQLDLGGHVIMDTVASAFAGQYGLQYLFLGLPPGTPYQTVPDFHL